MEAPLQSWLIRRRSPCFWTHTRTYAALRRLDGTYRMRISAELSKGCEAYLSSVTHSTARQLDQRRRGIPQVDRHHSPRKASLRLPGAARSPPSAYIDGTLPAARTLTKRAGLPIALPSRGTRPKSALTVWRRRSGPVAVDVAYRGRATGGGRRGGGREAHRERFCRVSRRGVDDKVLIS